MKSSRLQKISAVISLMVLAAGFVLMGIVSIFHQPANALGVGSTVSTVMGGCASMATGSIFSAAGLIFCRRTVGLVIA